MANINIEIDNELETKATELFKELGIDMQTAFNQFLRQAVDSKGNDLNDETAKVITEVDNKIGLSKTFISIDELMEDLNA